MITLRDQHVTATMKKAAKKSPRNIVLTPLEVPQKKTKVVFLGFPLDYKIAAIKDQQGVVFASACVVTRNREERGDFL